MSEPKSYDRRPEETDYQWLAYRLYRDYGPERTILKAYQEYSKKRYDARKHSKRPFRTPIAISSSFREWKAKFQWEERCKEYDLDQEAIQRQIRLEQDTEAYIAKLGEFRDTQMRIGKMANAVVLRALGKLVDFMNNQPEVTTISDAERLARLCASLKDATSLWAQGLQIEELLTQTDIHQG